MKFINVLCSDIHRQKEKKTEKRSYQTFDVGMKSVREM